MHGLTPTTHSATGGRSLGRRARRTREGSVRGARHAHDGRCVFGILGRPRRALPLEAAVGHVAVQVGLGAEAQIPGHDVERLAAGVRAVVDDVVDARALVDAGLSRVGVDRGSVPRRVHALPGARVRGAGHLAQVKARPEVLGRRLVGEEAVVLAALQELHPRRVEALVVVVVVQAGRVVRVAYLAPHALGQVPGGVVPGELLAGQVVPGAVRAGSPGHGDDKVGEYGAAVVGRVCRVLIKRHAVDQFAHGAAHHTEGIVFVVADAVRLGGQPHGDAVPARVRVELAVPQIVMVMRVVDALDEKGRVGGHDLLGAVPVRCERILDRTTVCCAARCQRAEQQRRHRDMMPHRVRKSRTTGLQWANERLGSE